MFRLITVLMIIGVAYIPDVAGQCPRPANDRHVSTFINDRYPLRLNSQKMFPEGTILISRCEDVQRYRFHGSTERECVGENWSAPPPTCQPSESQVIIYTNAKFEISNNGSFLIVEEGRQKLTITCRVGEAQLMIELYDQEAKVPSSMNKNFRSSKTLTINKPTPSHSGLYTCSDALNDQQLPMTVEIIILENAPMCTVPDAPENGKRSMPDMDVVPMATEIVYSCEKGYSLEGEQFTKCTSSGYFITEPPTCVAYLCQPPPPTKFKNGEVLGAEYYIGVSIGFICDEGFNIDGERFVNVKCLDSLEWSDEFPKGCRPDPTDGPTTTTTRRPKKVDDSSPEPHSASFSDIEM